MKKIYSILLFLTLTPVWGSAAQQNSEQLLLEAVRKGNISLVSRMLTISPTLINTPGLLHNCINRDNPNMKMIEFLIYQGIDVDSVDNLGLPYLCYAIRGKQPDIVKLLLDRGADPNGIGNLGLTYLYYTIRGRQPDIVNLLIDAGAVIAFENLDYAFYSNPEWVKNFFFYAAQYGKQHIIDHLRTNFKININCQDQDGNTPLHIATAHYQTDVVKYLMDLDADTNIQNQSHKTPFDMLPTDKEFENKLAALNTEKERNDIQDKQSKAIEINQILAGTYSAELTENQSHEHAQKKVKIRNQEDDADACSYGSDYEGDADDWIYGSDYEDDGTVYGDENNASENENQDT